MQFEIHYLFVANVKKGDFPIFSIQITLYFVWNVNHPPEPKNEQLTGSIPILSREVSSKPAKSISDRTTKIDSKKIRF